MPKYREDEKKDARRREVRGRKPGVPACNGRMKRSRLHNQRSITRSHAYRIFTTTCSVCKQFESPESENPDAHSPSPRTCRIRLVSIQPLHTVGDFNRHRILPQTNGAEGRPESLPRPVTSQRRMMTTATRVLSEVQPLSVSILFSPSPFQDFNL